MPVEDLLRSNEQRQRCGARSDGRDENEVAECRRRQCRVGEVPGQECENGEHHGQVLPVDDAPLCARHAAVSQFGAGVTMPCGACAGQCYRPAGCGQYFAPVIAALRQSRSDGVVRRTSAEPIPGGGATAKYRSHPAGAQALGKLEKSRHLAVHTGLGYPNRAGSNKPPNVFSHNRPRGLNTPAARIEDRIMDAKTGANIKTGKLNIRRQELVVPHLRRHDRPRRDRHRDLYAEAGVFTYDPGSPRPRAAKSRSRSSTATRASCSIAAIRSSSSPSTATFSRSATCCSTASCRPPQQKRTSTPRDHHTMVHEQMTGSFRASGATPTRWR